MFSRTRSNAFLTTPGEKFQLKVRTFFAAIPKKFLKTYRNFLKKVSPTSSTVQVEQVERRFENLIENFLLKVRNPKFFRSNSKKADNFLSFSQKVCCQNVPEYE